MCACVCVSFTGSQAIHQTKFSHHTHTHKQNQRTDSSMKASSSRCRRSLCLWLYHAASLLAATKTAKKMFAPLPTAFWGKVFNLLHMHAKRGGSGGGEKGVVVSSSECASSKLLLRRSLCCTNLQARSALIRSHTLPLSLSCSLSLSVAFPLLASPALHELSASLKNELQAWDLQVARAGEPRQVSVCVSLCVCVCLWVRMCVPVCLCVCMYLLCRNMTFNLHKLCAFVSPPHAKHAEKFNSKKSAYPFLFSHTPSSLPSHSTIPSSLTFTSTAWLMSIKEERWSFMESKSKLSTLFALIDFPFFSCSFSPLLSSLSV